MNVSNLQNLFILLNKKKIKLLNYFPSFFINLSTSVNIFQLWKKEFKIKFLSESSVKEE